MCSRLRPRGSVAVQNNASMVSCPKAENNLSPTCKMEFLSLKIWIWIHWGSGFAFTVPRACCRINRVWWRIDSWSCDTSWTCRCDSWRTRRPQWWNPWASRWSPLGTKAVRVMGDKAWEEKKEEDTGFFALVMMMNVLMAKWDKNLHHFVSKSRVKFMKNPI